MGEPLDFSTQDPHDELWGEDEDSTAFGASTTSDCASPDKTESALNSPGEVPTRGSFAHVLPDNAV